MTSKIDRRYKGPLTKSETQRINQLYRQGYSRRKIHKMLDISLERVSNHLNSVADIAPRSNSGGYHRYEQRTYISEPVRNSKTCMFINNEDLESPDYCGDEVYKHHCGDKLYNHSYCKQHFHLCYKLKRGD